MDYFKTNEAFNFFHLLPFPGLLLRVDDDKYIITEATDHYCQKTSTTRETLVGKEYSEIFPDASDLNRVQIEKSFKKVFESKKAEELSVLRYEVFDSENSSYHEKSWQVYNYPIESNSGNPKRYICHILIEKTAKKALTQENDIKVFERFNLAEQQKVFIKNNTDGLYSLDPKGNFLSVNEGLVQIAEFPEKELLEMSFLPFCAEEDRQRIVELFQKAVAGVPQQFEGNFVSGKGRKMVLSIDLLPMRIQGEILGAYGIAKDITLLRKSEKSLSQKKQLLQLHSRIINVLVAKGINSTNLQFIFEEIGKTIEVDRIYYFGKSLQDLKGQDIIAGRIDWIHSGFEPDSCRQGELWFERILAAFGPFRDDSVITTSIEIELQQKLLEEYAIESLMLIPVFSKDEFSGVVGIESKSRLKTWQEDEIELLKSLLKSILSFVEKKAADLEIEKKKEELLETQKKFEYMVEEGSDLIGILTQEGIYKFVSASSSRVLGIDPEDFIGKKAFDFIHKKDRDRVIAEFSALDHKKQIKISAFRFKDGTGKWRWVETMASNLLDIPQVKGIVTNSRDVTQEVIRTRELKELNDRYKLASAITRDLMYDWNLNTDEVIRYSEGKELMFGYAPEDMKTQDFWRDHIHPEDQFEYNEQLETALNCPQTNQILLEYRFRKSTGDYASIIDKGHIIRDANKKPIGLIGATSDITEMIANREALNLANIRFKYAMEATREMIWDWNIKENTIFRSKTFKKLYGYDDTPATVDHFWLDKIYKKDGDKIKKSLYEALEDPKRSKWKEEYRFLKKNGQKADVIDRGFIIRNQNGEAIRMVGATLDVSESRRLINEISKQNKVLKEITWEQAHMVRAPLTRLMGLVQFLKLKIHDEWSQDDLVDLISDSANELDDIVIKIVQKSEEQ